MANKKKQFTWGTIGGMLLLAIVAGALAGVIATVYTTQSLEDYARTLGERERLFQISQERPRPLPGTYEEALGRVQEAGWPAMALVRPASDDSLDANDWVTAQSAVGHGTVVTSDGWVLFSQDAFAGFANPQIGAEIWIQSERYEIEEIVEDSLTPFILVKVNATSLSTLAFGSSGDMLGGDLLFALQSSRETIPTSLSNSEKPVNGPVLPAETYISEWELTDSLDEPSPLLNAAGELVGFTYEENLAIPLHHVRPFIQAVLRHNEPRYAGLGAYVVSVSDVLNLDPSITERTAFGALVTAPDARTLAVVVDGPADEAGLEEGDIIISVDDVLITERQSLAELLKAYEPGQAADLSVLRNGETLDVTLEFMNLSDLLVY